MRTSNKTKEKKNYVTHTIVKRKYGYFVYITDKEVYTIHIYSFVYSLNHSRSLFIFWICFFLFFSFSCFVLLVFLLLSTSISYSKRRHSLIWISNHKIYVCIYAWMHIVEEHSDDNSRCFSFFPQPAG